MRGRDHYREAEKLLAGVTMNAVHPDGSPVIRSDEPQAIAAAQVHATLALAAATADLAGITIKPEETSEVTR